jgi:hypothetical protein
MRDIPVRVVNALYELHQIIEETRRISYKAGAG